MPLRLGIHDGDRWTELPPPAQLVFLSQTAWIQKALSLAAEIGIADLLADGPRHVDDLAQATSSHPQALYRVLRLLSALGIFSEPAPYCFTLTPMSQCFRSDAPDSLRAWLHMVGQPIWYHASAMADYSLRTGNSAFARAMGADLFEYLGTNPDDAAVFNAAMSSLGSSTAAAVVQAYDFSGFSTIADVGGGYGSLAMEILRTYPTMSGIIFDLPYVADSTRAVVASAGLDERCAVVEGDFFEAVPAGADAYLLRWVLHDWDHERAATILRNCRSAMSSSSSRVLIVESVLPPQDEPHLGKLMDFVMLSALGGQERTEAEYAQLLQDAGLRLNRVVPMASAFSVIEAVVDESA